MQAAEAAAADRAKQVDYDKAEEEIEEEEESEESRAQRIVRTLYGRYEKQMQRWGNYNQLFAFLGFVGLLLMVLYLQRVSDISYKVHDTVWAVVQPSSMSYQSKSDVYDWINNLLTTIWADPVCGDGLCEEPFEYPSYGRFGCRADCGQMTDKYNLTTIQIDITYDFNHPVGSLPASVRAFDPLRLFVVGWAAGRKAVAWLLSQPQASPPPSHLSIVVIPAATRPYAPTNHMASPAVVASVLR